MRIQKVFIFKLMMIFSLQISFAQKGPDVFSKKLEDILTLNDVNEKKHQLSIFNTNLSDWLKANNTGNDIVEPLKFSVSGDKKFSVIYYVRKGVKNIEYTFFVRYENIEGSVQVHYFIENIIPDMRSLESINDPVMNLTSKMNDGVKFYEVSFHDNGNPLIWEKYADLELKCLFEESGITKNDELKRKLNGEILNRLKKIWNDPSMFSSDLPGLKRMKTIFSPDEKIKLCTYGLSFSDFSNMFYGAVIVKEKRGDKPDAFLLNDVSDDIRSPLKSTLTDKKWYGAVYLDIIETKNQKKTFYTLLGYKGQDEFVKTRVVDVLWFAGGKPRFGSPIFKNGRYSYNRLIFKYSIGANMLLRYDEKQKMIVMDNLVPSEPFYKEVYSYYGPDATYNGYKFEKGKWILYKNIDLRNPK